MSRGRRRNPERASQDRSCLKMAKRPKCLKGEKTMANIETLKKLGREWQGGDKHRIYFNDLAGLYGLETSHYNSGNISEATLDGGRISNSQAREIASDLSMAKIWYDYADNKFYGNGCRRINDYFGHIVNAIKAKSAEMEAEKVT